MSDKSRPVAIVAGISPGLGGALCRRLAGAGYRVTGLARMPDFGAILAQQINHEEPLFTALSCDLTDPDAVAEAVARIESDIGGISIYVHNAARLLMAPFLETPPAEFEALWRTFCLGAVHGAQRVLPGMLERSSGKLLFIGATASVKAGAHFAAFSAAKFALRGLAQSLAREYGPKGIHVAHLVIDGVMWGDRAHDNFGMKEEQCLAPDAVAETCLQIIQQHRSAWTHELDLRPNGETF